MTGAENDQGRPVADDPNAPSADPTLPAFIARPPGAPVYHGFVILDETEVDGFRLGKITDFEAEPTDDGDAFVVAPDGSRAGLVWEISTEPYFSEIMPPDQERWGVWGVGFRHPMRTPADAKKNLEEHLPTLRIKWEDWRATRA
jgi:hypothetical protein